MKKMWEGRFQKPTAKIMEPFNRSLDFDMRLYDEDIQGSRAYALALQKIGILSRGECRKIRNTLEKIHRKIGQGRARFLPEDEDIHMAVERLLIAEIGEAGAKIHTGRSRNEQVASDTRQYAKKSACRIMDLIRALQSAILERAKKNKGAWMAGYTHLQQAQPLRLSHYLLSFFFALERDKERFARAIRASDVLVLGSGALAGSAFPLDRKLLARELGFKEISPNSLDAVSDRDFVLEFLFAASLCMMHLSRYAEDLVIWSSREFGFVELSDAYATGSSMMPQKKNPDSLELIRGKTGRVFGNLLSVLTVLKGLPLSYGKDMQEDKEAFFDSADTLETVLQVFEGVLRTAVFHIEKMRAGLSDMLLATDIADFLSRRGLPFRKAHALVGKIAAHCLEHQKQFAELTAGEWKNFSPLFPNDFSNKISFEDALENRNIMGGTGSKAVAAQILLAQRLLAKKGNSK